MTEQLNRAPASATRSTNSQILYRRMMSEENEALRLHSAKEAVKEIKAGNAWGFLPSLYGRAVVESFFEGIGKRITTWPPVVAAVLLGTVVLAFGMLCTGFLSGHLETDVADLWIETGGRLDKEIEYTEDHLNEDFSTTEESVVQLVKTDNLSASLYDHLQLLKAATEITFSFGSR